MAVFPVRDKHEEADQLLEMISHNSSINVSADLHNALARAAVRKIGEHRLKMITMTTLRTVEAQCYKENPRTSVVVVPRHGEKVHLRLYVLDVEKPKDGWERSATVKVAFPIHGYARSDGRCDQERFIQLLIATAGISMQSLAIKGNGLVTRVTLYGDNVPIKWHDPDNRLGRAWETFVCKGEIL